jgi:hypothetical protein
MATDKSFENQEHIDWVYIIPELFGLAYMF